MLRISRCYRHVHRYAAPLSRQLTPAPAASWDPAAERRRASALGQTIGITVRLPEDAVLETRARVGFTLLEALEAADLSDVWEGGACGGACNCSTCRVMIDACPVTLRPRGEEEEDMLDTAATATERLGNDHMAGEYLLDASRLACQLTLQAEHDGLILTLPDDVTNVLEVPLWLRGSR